LNFAFEKQELGAVVFVAFCFSSSYFARWCISILLGRLHYMTTCEPFHNIERYISSFGSTEGKLDKCLGVLNTCASYRNPEESKNENET
jgi:hypothetical protein